MSRYEGLVNIPERGKIIEEMNLFCIPTPLERPRLGKGGRFYTPRDNQRYLYKEVNYYAKSRTIPINVPTIVDCFFYFKFIGRTVQFPTSKKFGDVDNLTKAVYDSVSASTNVIKSGLVVHKIIKDDSLIIGGESYKLFDKEDEDGNTEDYIVVRIYEVN